MKKLPRIYKNEKIHPKNNNTSFYKINNEKETIIEENHIEKELHKIFNGMGHSYNISVIIKTKEKLYNTYLLSKTEDTIITIENERIPIKDIIFLKIKN